ncbi:hypothetical protein BsWGS_21812 [Bradybaena similaris]
MTRVRLLEWEIHYGTSSDDGKRSSNDGKWSSNDGKRSSNDRKRSSNGGKRSSNGGKRRSNYRKSATGGTSHHTHRHLLEMTALMGLSRVQRSRFFIILLIIIKCIR